MNPRGQSIIEYALILGVVSIVLTGALEAYRSGLENTFRSINGVLPQLCPNPQSVPGGARGELPVNYPGPGSKGKG